MYAGGALAVVANSFEEAVNILKNYDDEKDHASPEYRFPYRAAIFLRDWNEGEKLGEEHEWDDKWVLSYEAKTDDKGQPRIVIDSWNSA
jgi:hypothetical protein